MTTVAKLVSNISQERLNTVFIFWLVVLTVIFGFQVYWDYTGVMERNRKLNQIYETSLQQQARYEVILKAEEERLGIKHEANK